MAGGRGRDRGRVQRRGWVRPGGLQGGVGLVMPAKPLPPGPQIGRGVAVQGVPPAILVEPFIRVLTGHVIAGHVFAVFAFHMPDQGS